MKTKIKFWGVRGSIPAPLTPEQVEAKITTIVKKAVHCLPKGAAPEVVEDWVPRSSPFHARSTYGGNTSCVEVRIGGHLFILDLGTGIRMLGKSLFPEMVANKGVTGTVFCSHVHWDHIQGFPFWPQIYAPASKFFNRFAFYGGRDWDSSLEDVLKGQMNPPVFPVDLRELNRTGMKMTFHTVHDEWRDIFYCGEGAADAVHVSCRKLNHPQETYGYRIVSPDAKVIVYTTDHEPFVIPHAPLVDCVRGADVWITDCQYSHDIYTGKIGGVPRTGWGHSYPEYIAEVALVAKPKKIVTFHHDPDSDDLMITQIAQQVEKLTGIPTVAAYEGLEIDVESSG